MSIAKSFAVRHLEYHWTGVARYDLRKGNSSIYVIGKDGTEIQQTNQTGLFELYDVDLIDFLDAKAQKESER